MDFWSVDCVECKAKAGMPCWSGVVEPRMICTERAIEVVKTLQAMLAAETERWRTWIQDSQDGCGRELADCAACQILNVLKAEMREG